MARRVRDGQWDFMGRVYKAGTLWVCPWDKYGKFNNKPTPEDLTVFCLVSWMETLEWISSHEDWWVKGEWSEERYAFPMSLTEAGKVVFENQAQYDMEYVTGGMVEPGWRCRPAERKNVA